jgi:arsenate reductase (glutaredoxin)
MRSPRSDTAFQPGGAQGLLAISQDVMANGSIKFFNATKGFGFITPEDGSKDVFVPAASVTASGISALKPGQLVSFDTEPDSKGPKAVNLKLLADAPKPVPKPMERPAPPPQEAASPRLTVFHDPASDASHLVLAVLEDAEQEPQLVDYIATPPDRDALKNLSLLLRGGDQSLVRKYDPLFLELRLDDRFISDGDFWAAIVEHPSLINGPVLATAQKARVCRTEQAVKAFLGIVDAGPAAAKPKGLPGNIAAAVTGGAAVKTEESRKAETRPVEAPRAKAPAPKKIPVETKPEIKPKPKAKAEAKPKAAPKPKAKLKAVVKTVRAAKPVKKPAAKPVKKTQRGAKK